MPEPDVTQFFVSLVGGGVGGSITGGIIAHRLTKKRSREARKTDLLAFLTVWETQIVDDRKIVNNANVAQKIADRFDADMHKLLDFAVKAEPNFKGERRASFDALVQTIRKMTPGGVESAEGKKNLLAAIQKLAAFVRDS